MPAHEVPLERRLIADTVGLNGVPLLLMHQMALVRNSDIHHGQLLVYVCVVTVIL